MNIYIKFCGQVFLQIMQTCHTAKNADQQYVLMKELLANARHEKEIQVHR